MEDRELSQAVVAYLQRGGSSFPGTDGSVAALSTDADSAASLLARVRAIVDEMMSIKIDWATSTLSEGGREAQRVLAAQHPELGQVALEALYWMFTYNWR